MSEIQLRRIDGGLYEVIDNNDESNSKSGSNRPWLYHLLGKKVKLKEIEKGLYIVEDKEE